MSATGTSSGGWYVAVPNAPPVGPYDEAGLKGKFAVTSPSPWGLEAIRDDRAMTGANLR